MAHITGGGLPENLPRCLAENQSIKIDPHSWPILPVFNFFAKFLAWPGLLNETFLYFGPGY
jgi:phosphoribosylaminoimidazole (AIR) synthetase